MQNKQLTKSAVITGIGVFLVVLLFIAAQGKDRLAPPEVLTALSHGSNPLIVKTLDPSGETSVTAELNGQVNPNGYPATAWFRYWKDDPGTCNDTFGTLVTTDFSNNGTNDVNYSKEITNLISDEDYFYCAIAQNAFGKKFGDIHSIHTATPPLATTLPASNIGATSADLNGTVDPNGYPATAWFRYWKDDPGTCNDTFGIPIAVASTFSGATPVAIPRQTITGLSAGTKYYFCAVAQNVGGTNFGSLLNFTTLLKKLTVEGISLSDTTLPTVSITSPLGSATLSGTITISASASDNVGVTEVQFKRGTTILGTDTASPYSVSFNTTTVQNGSYTFSATAKDAAGNTRSASVTVNVSNIVVSPSYTLTVTKSGTGSGIVTSSHLSCGADCTEAYNSGTVVTLTAAPSDGSSFSSWSSNCTPLTTDPKKCTVTMNGAKTVTTTFLVSAPPTTVACNNGLDDDDDGLIDMDDPGCLSATYTSEVNVGCGNITEVGTCLGNTVNWCENNILKQQSCTELGGRCGLDPESENYLCLFDQVQTDGQQLPSTTSVCGTLGFEGRCEGNNVIWCEMKGTGQEELKSQTCPSNMSCGLDFSNSDYPRGFANCLQKSECRDGIDNDNDGKIDYPADPGCTSANDISEVDVVSPPSTTVTEITGCPRYIHVATLRPRIHRTKPWLKPTIRGLQEALNAYILPQNQGDWYPLEIDGLYGGLTLKAVWAYQEQEGLVKDKIVGSKETAPALERSYQTCITQ